MGAGMDFLTRPLILSLSVMVIIGCTSKPIKSSYELFYDSITTDKIQLSQSIKDLRYASSIMQLDNKDEIFSVLASYRNGSHKWVTSDDKVFIIDYAGLNSFLAFKRFMTPNNVGSQIKIKTNDTEKLIKTQTKYITLFQNSRSNSKSANK